MICLICRKAETINGLTSVIFARGDINLVINKVAALVCPNCGEAFLEEEVTVKLLHDAQEISLMGGMNIVHDSEG